MRRDVKTCGCGVMRAHKCVTCGNDLTDCSQRTKWCPQCMKKRIALRARAYGLSHREHIAKYTEEHRDAKNESSRRYAAKNREKIKAKNKRWADGNRERVRQTKRLNYLRNREIIVQQKRLRRMKESAAMGAARELGLI